MQLSPISLAITRLGGVRFSPAALFPSGTAGAWYDPSDSTTLFSDTAGTTPSPTPGGGALSVVGLMLDKSQGLALGSELVTPEANRDFSSDTGYWIKTGGATISGGVASGPQYSAIARNALLTSGVLYEVQWTVVAGQIKVSLGTNQSALLGPGTYTTRLLANGLAITFYFDGASGGTLDNVSVKQVSGNHAISYNTTTARPELSARVNLLTYSEQFDNGLWVKNSGSVSANSTVAPDGTTTADTFTSTAAAAAHNLQFNGLSAYSQSNLNHTAVVSVKAGTHNFVTLSFSSGSADAWAAVTVDLSTGTATKTGNGLNGTLVGTPTVVSQGNGWYRISLTARYASGVGTYCWIYTNSSGTPTYGSYGGETWTPVGTETVFVWGADLRPTNIGTGVPSYQRIADQYTYDSSGFPRYLKFDGIDDGMYTPANLNLNGTAQATVFAGVRKISDAGTGTVVQFSTSTATNDGVFGLFAPFNTGASADYAWQSKGTSRVTVNSGILTGPATSVFTGIGNVSAPLATLRQNAVQASTSASSQGTGNFGNFALYVGYGSGSLNGYIYSLIVVGAASTAAQISSTESWINSKEGGVY